MSSLRLPLEKKDLIWQRVGYDPNPEAMKAHAAENRVLMVAGGERAGKSFSAAMEALPHALLPNSLGWIVGPTYELARPEFSYIVEALGKMNLLDENKFSFPRQGPAALRTRTGGEVVTRSADDPIKLAAKAPDWVLMCEAAQMSYEVFLRLRGRVAEKRGWLWISGTFEGSLGWYPEYWQRWQASNDEGAISFSIPTWANVRLYPQGKDDAEIKLLRATYPPEVFQERFDAIPCPPASLVFKEFSFGTHVKSEVQYLDRYPVEVWTDPGYSGSFYAVLFVQFVPRAVTREFIQDISDANVTDVWVIDELYMQHAIHEDVINAAKEKAFWGAVNGGVGDVVMKTHPMAGKAPIDVWYEKAGFILRGEKVDVKDGIDRHRTFLRDPAHAGMPRLFIHPRCKGLTGEYGRWKRKELGENLFGEPEKTNCDALKALNYGLIDQFGFVDREEREKKEKKRVPGFAAAYRGVG